MLPSPSARSARASSSRRRQRGVLRPPKRSGAVLPPRPRSSARSASALFQRRVMRLLVEDRIGEAGADEHVAEIVHVDEGRRRRRPAERRVERAQLAQRVRAEAGEGDDALDLEQRMPACHQRRRIDDEGQDHVGPDELGAADRGVARRCRARPPPRRPPSDHHGPSLDCAPALGPSALGLDRDALGARVALAQQRVAVARAGPPLDDARRLGAQRREPLDQPARDLAVQPRRRRRRGRGGPAPRAPRRRRGRVPAGHRRTPWPGSILRRCMRHDAEAMPAPPLPVSPGDPAPRGRFACRACARCAAAGAGAPSARAASERFAAPVPRCRRCALQVPSRRRRLRGLPRRAAAVRRRPRVLRLPARPGTG